MAQPDGIPSASGDPSSRLHFTMRCPVLFSFDAVWRIHGWSFLAPNRAAGLRNASTLSLLGGRVVTVGLSETPEGLGIDVDSELTPPERDELGQRISRMMSFDFPLDGFIEQAEMRKADKLRQLAEEGWGRMLRSASPWEDAVKTLCTTNASWSNTVRMCDGLVRELGCASASGHKAFPSPKAVCDAGSSVLAEACRMGYRVRYLLELAERALNGDCGWLTGVSCPLDFPDAREVVSGWAGFGPYATAHMLVLLGDHSVLPVDREVGTHLGVRQKHGRRLHRATAFSDWGAYRFTAYKLDRVLRKINWIGEK
jgi:3-methyladenine DNA glycosylase/8-oxoguanine DNA glycosylase